MSCNDRESGSYTLPANEFSRLKREIKIQWDNYVEKVFQKTTLAQVVYLNSPVDNVWGNEPIQEAFSNDDEYVEAKDLFLRKTQKGNWAKPLKSDLQKAKFNSVAKASKDGVVRLPCHTGSISINTSDRAISWNVNENNNSVKSSRSHPVADWFLNRFLPSVKWTPKTGGMISYTNEFMNDDEYSQPQEKDLYGKCDPQQRMNPRPQPEKPRYRIPSSFRF